MRTHIVRRLLMLWTVELLNVFLFAFLVVWFRVLGYRIGALSVVGVICVNVVLLQGSYYWFRKWRAVRAGQPHRVRRLRGLYYVLQRVNWVIGGVVAAVFVGGWGQSSLPDACFGLGLFVFAILEYVNYYHWQLMYDNRRELQWLAQQRRFKVAILRRDLL